MNGKKILSFLMALVMVFGVLPFSATAAQPTEAAMTAVPTAEQTILSDTLPESETTPLTQTHSMKVLHLDCGRKYFSADWVKALIAEMAANGYTHLQLAFGNDGLRFLLDDVSVAGYSSQQVAEAVRAGNRLYNDLGTNELTQSEMTDIITYANNQGIEIIPLMNMPGHMNALLSAMNTLMGADVSYAGSASTVDLNNEAAIAFLQELGDKYAAYFAAQGCTYFNIGADEYANDIGAMGINGLVQNGMYPELVSFINTMNAKIRSHGMTTMAFNDSFYYGGHTEAAFDPDIVIMYWSAGWGGYNLAPAATLQSKGHQLLNTNGDFYYVLGKTWPSDRPEKDFHTAGAARAKDFDRNAFVGGTIENALGSVFCIWCDSPDAETEQQIAANIRMPMRAMSLAMEGRNNEIDAMSSHVVANGFNADGSLNVRGSQPQVMEEETLTLEMQTQAQPNILPNTQADLSTDGIVSADEHVRYQVESRKTTPAAGKRYTLGKKITSNLTAGTYAIVSKNGNTLTALAMEADGRLTSVTLQPGQEVPENARWTVSKSRSNYTIKNGNRYLAYETNRSGKPESLKTQDRSFNFQFGSNGFFMYYEGSWFNPDGDYYFDYSSGWTVGTNTAKAAAPYKLNEENVPAEPTWRHTVTFYGDTPTDTATEVVIGNVRYLVNVIPEDLSHVTPVKIEYWITNAPVSGIPSNEEYRNVSAMEAYGEAGTDVSALVDPLGKNPEYEDREYWQCRLLDTTQRNNSADGREEQTQEPGDDDTEGGVAFTKIRYFNSQWQVFTENGRWVTVTRNHQLVAYYLEVVNIFDKTGKGELHVNTSDWGYGGSQNNWDQTDKHCSISFQIIYESGSSNPSATTANPLAEKTIVYNWWTRRGVGTLMFDGQDRYEIDHIDSMLGMMSPQSANSSGPITSFEWHPETTETVWNSNGNPQERVSINNTTGRPSTEGVKRNLTWLKDTNAYRPERFDADRNNNAILLQVYVKAKKTEDALTVHYLEGRSGGLPMEFYGFNIAVEQGTTFDPGFAKGNAKNTLVQNSVKNFSGEMETVTADLTKLPLIDPLYRLSNFTLQEVIRSEDGKDVYLYYSFENQRKAFVADFGLPMTFTGSDLGPNLEIKSVSRDADYGTVRLGTNSFTYTPNRVMNGYESLLASVTDNAEDTGDQLAIIQVYILPASNVLYEEGFFDAASTTDSLNDWEGGSRGVSKQSAANQAPYGYDTAYTTSTGNSEGSAYIASVDAAHNTENLTVTFTGSGFDLIGDSAPDTGMIMLALKGPESKLVLIDTSHSVKNLTQVPLAHLELTEGTYTATVMGGFRAAPKADSGRMSVMSARPDSSMTAFEKAVQQFMKEEDIETVEYISAETGMMTPVSANRPMVMATAPAAAVSTQNGSRVAIDGFRVYRSSDTEAYVPAERNVNYTNVLDALKNTELTAYVDNRNGAFTVGTYEALGGPQNEVYLSKGQSVALKTGLGDAFQVSLRAVEGPTTAKINSSSRITLNHQTELYYEVNASSQGYVTITNDGDGLLAIGNVKHQKALLNLTEADYPAVFALLAAPVQPEPTDPVDPEPTNPTDPMEPEEPDFFEPERLNAKVKSSTLFGKKKCTLTVKTSADVDYITVNGQRVDARRGGLSGWKQPKELKFTFQQTVGKKDTAVFEIIAYDADGNASQVHTVRK